MPDPPLPVQNPISEPPAQSGPQAQPSQERQNEDSRVSIRVIPAQTRLSYHVPGRPRMTDKQCIEVSVRAIKNIIIQSPNETFRQEVFGQLGVSNSQEAEAEIRRLFCENLGISEQDEESPAIVRPILPLPDFSFLNSGPSNGRFVTASQPLVSPATIAQEANVTPAGLPAHEISQPLSQQPGLSQTGFIDHVSRITNANEAGGMAENHGLHLVASGEFDLVIDETAMDLEENINPRSYYTQYSQPTPGHSQNVNFIGPSVPDFDDALAPLSPSLLDDDMDDQYDEVEQEQVVSSSIFFDDLFSSSQKSQEGSPNSLQSTSKKILQQY